MEPKKARIRDFLTTDVFFRKPLVPMPNELKKELIALVAYTAISTLALDIIAFALQISKDAIANGYVILAVMLVAIYSLNRTISGKYWLTSASKQDIFYEHCETTMHKYAVKVLMNVKGRIYKNVDGKNEVVSSTEIIDTFASVVSKLWHIEANLLEDATRVISLLVSLIGFLVVTSVEIENTLLFFVIIIAISAITIYFSQKKVEANTILAKPLKDSRDRKEEAKNDILNIEAIDDDHLNFMYMKFDKASTDLYARKRERWLNMNKNENKKYNWEAVAILVIVAIKIYETGLSNIQLETIFSIVAILGIYSQIMSKITRVISMSERYKTEVEELCVYKDDFFEIMRHHNAQLEKKAQPVGVIDTLIIPEGEIKYKFQATGTPFKVKVCKPIELKLSDIVLFSGPTGCGKSTILKAIVGSTIFDNYALRYNFITEGRAEVLMHHTDVRLGCNDILSELTFGKKDFDRAKLLRILKGLHLYEEISEKNPDVLRYLADSKADKFSNGQKQRLLIARLLFNLKDDVQVIAFDEATNALNDEITDKVLRFITEFCEGRLLLFVSHQVSIYDWYATKHFCYMPGDEENSYRVNP